MMAVCIFLSAAGMSVGEVIRLIAGWIGKRTDEMFDWKPAEDSASANTAEGWLDEIGVSQGQRPEYGNCTFWREKKDGNELIVFRSEAEKRLYVAEAFM